MSYPRKSCTCLYVLITDYLMLLQILNFASKKNPDFSFFLFLPCISPIVVKKNCFSRFFQVCLSPAVSYLLQQGLWSPNLASWWLTMKNFHPKNYTSFLTSGHHVRPHNKFKTLFPPPQCLWPPNLARLLHSMTSFPA